MDAKETLGHRSCDKQIVIFTITFVSIYLQLTNKTINVDKYLDIFLVSLSLATNDRGKMNERDVFVGLAAASDCD